MIIICARCISVALFAICLAWASPASPDSGGSRQISVPVRIPAAKGGAEHTLVCRLKTGARVPVCAVAFSPDGKTLAAAGYREVVLWDLTGAPPRSIGRDCLTGVVHALAFADQGKLLIVGDGMPGRSGAVRILDAAGKVTSALDQPKDVVNALALNPGEKLLAGGGADGIVYVWSMESRKLVATLKGHTGAIQSLSFSPDGKLLASGSDDRTARVWQTSNWQPAAALDQLESVHGVAFTSDSQQLVVAVGGNTDRNIRFRNWSAGWQSQAVDLGAGVPLGFTWSLAANRACVPCSDGAVRVIATDRWPAAVILTLTGHTDWVESAALSPDGRRVASAGADGTLRLWSAIDGVLVATLVRLAPGTDGWAIVTGQGYAAASSPESVSWQGKDLRTPVTRLRSLLLKPDSVAKALAGHPDPPPALEWLDRSGAK